MSLDNRIKVQSNVTIRKRIGVNLFPPEYVWHSISAGDDTVYYRLDEITSDYAWTTGVADVHDEAEFDLSEVDNTQAGTYPINVSFKGLETSYQITIQEVTMNIEVSNYTDDYFYGDDIYFDGDCWAHYNKPGIDSLVEPTEIHYPEEYQLGWNTISIYYYDDYYNIGANTSYKIKVQPTPDEDTIIADFTQIEDFDEWGTSYLEHSLDYEDINILFEAANHQEDVITDMPVVRGRPIYITSTNPCRWFNTVSIIFEQWQNKGQTAVLDYSIDGGRTWVENVATSSDFWLIAELPEGVKPDALRIRFLSTSNQVGVKQCTCYTTLEDEPIHRLWIDGPNSVEVEESFELEATCPGYEDQVVWSSDNDVEFEITGDMTCTAVSHETGAIVINATCLGASASKQIVVTGSASYETSINFPDVYTETTDLQNVQLLLDDITLVFDKGSNTNTPKYMPSGTAVRAYGNNTIHFTCSEGYSIIKIEFEITQSREMSVNTGEYIEPNWGGESNDILFTVSGGSGHIRIRSIKVTYTEQEATFLPPDEQNAGPAE